MGSRRWQGCIAAWVLVVFAAGALAWAAEEAAPRFLEKEGRPAVARHRKFPWLPVLLGAGAATALILVLTKRKEETLTVDMRVGVTGTPAATAKFRRGSLVRYQYSLKQGFGDLAVWLDGRQVPASGSVAMDGPHKLTASAGKEQVLAVSLGAGTTGTPVATASYPRSQVVHYGYRAASGGAVYVRLDGVLVAASGSVTMDRDHALTASASGSVASYAGGVLTVNGIRYELAPVPAGEFLMGSDSPEASRDEKPVHRVRISRPFRLGRTEVTQELWQAVMGNNPSKFPCGGRYPVEEVVWDDTQAFIRSLNHMLGRDAFRLPTEAEWEWAARAGTTADRYGAADDIAWYLGNSGGQTHPVGQKRPNALGLFDVLGNVWEWCQDCWGDYTDEYQVDPVIPCPDNRRSGYIYRGCSWETPFVRLSLRDRNHFHDGLPKVSIGFRLAASD
jgi:formylglycine-generating enzyme required for sulfatase activity